MQIQCRVVWPSLQSQLNKRMPRSKEFIFTQSKGDVVQWQVQAKQARLFEQDKRAVLRDVALTFYGTGGDEVTVHGEEGNAGY